MTQEAITRNDNNDRTTARDTALVFSAHNWKSNRQAGFHKLAEVLCRRGLDVDFVSFPRPYYGALKRHELFNARSLWRLTRGREYAVEGRTLTNFTCPTLALPAPTRRWVPAGLFAALETAAFPSLIGRIRRRRRAYRWIVFESTSCVRLYPAIRRFFPSAKVAYRPSDPLPHASPQGPNQDAERQLLEQADVVLLVNEEGRALYGEAYPQCTLDGSRIQMLPNGVDVSRYRQTYPRPEGFGQRKVAAYVGTWAVDWEVILHCADRLPAVDFQIVRPDRLPRRFRDEVRRRPNVIYTPGIPPAEVPRYITNCDAVIVPYLAGTHLRCLGLHAKLLQAMAAGRPLATLNLAPELKRYGVAVAADREGFLRILREALDAGETTYPVDLEARSWSRFQEGLAAALGL